MQTPTEHKLKTFPRLTDPLYAPTPADAAFLDACTRQVIEKRPFSADQKKARKGISERIAVEATQRLLLMLEPQWRTMDANVVIKANNDGHDLIVENAVDERKRLTVSVKGCSYLEMTQFSLPSDRDRGAWRFDILVLVDSGVTLDRLGRFPHVMNARKASVDFFIFSRDEAIAELAHACRDQGKPDVYIYRWWAPRKPGSKEERHQIRDIERYRNSFRTIEDALTRL